MDFLEAIGLVFIIFLLITAAGNFYD